MGQEEQRDRQIKASLESNLEGRRPPSHKPRLSTNHENGAPRQRQHERGLKIHVHVQMNDHEITGSAIEINTQGIQVLSEVLLSPGTPLALQFSFSDVCYLNISGQVTYCLSSGTSGKHAMGIKFS